MVKEQDVMYLNEKLVTWRRDFHMYPEVGFQEVRTSKKIQEILASHNVEFMADFFSTAVIAVIDSGQEGPVIGLRSDIDALGMDDAKDVSYKSRNPGACHACGHDAHTAIGLGVAIYLNEHKECFRGKVKIVFQPAEEGPAPGGAKGVIESGEVDDLDYMIGLHCNPDHEVGTAVVRYGAMLASGDNFVVTIKGVGAHGAYPHQGKDPIATAIQIMDAFRHMQTRELDPVKEVAISVCSFQAGKLETTNVIPSEAKFSGTVRTLDNNVRNYIIERMQKIANGIAELNECECEMEIAFVSPALINDKEINDIFSESILECSERGRVHLVDVPEMGYDDFARFGEVCRSGYLYWGTKIEGQVSLYHHPEWDVNEESLSLGVALLANSIGKLSNKK